jgi:hypothetical protein
MNMITQDEIKAKLSEGLDSNVIDISEIGDHCRKSIKAMIDDGTLSPNIDKKAVDELFIEGVRNDRDLAPTSVRTPASKIQNSLLGIVSKALFEENKKAVDKVSEVASTTGESKGRTGQFFSSAGGLIKNNKWKVLGIAAAVTTISIWLGSGKSASQNDTTPAKDPAKEAAVEKIRAEAASKATEANTKATNEMLRKELEEQTKKLEEQAKEREEWLKNRKKPEKTTHADKLRENPNSQVGEIASWASVAETRRNVVANQSPKGENIVASRGTSYKDFALKEAIIKATAGATKEV